jgi:thiamine pyrophosphate-dependent acetolactate synthase large subunit-like protein
VTDDGGADLGQVARLLAGAKRPLILAGRGAHLAGAGPELRELADRLGALTAGTALALNLLNGEGYLGVAGGFGTDTAAGLMGEADVVLVAGASLSPFTMRFGHLLGPDSTVIQIDTALQPTHPRVDLFVSADAKSAAGRLLQLLDGEAAADPKPGARKPASAWPKDRPTTPAPTRPRTAGWTPAPCHGTWTPCCRSAARWSRTAGTSSAGHPCTGTSRGRRTW